MLLRQTSERAAAGGISVRGASLNFCQLNGFQMHEFPVWPHPVQMPSLPAEPPQIGHVGANRGVPIFLKGELFIHKAFSSLNLCFRAGEGVMVMVVVGGGDNG